MSELMDAQAKVTAEVNSIFAKMGATVQEEIDRGATALKVVDIAQRAGLEIDDRVLDELKIDRIIYVHPWLPWHHWWPWRPLWCWWWNRYYPWYRCCPYWWHRCSYLA